MPSIEFLEHYIRFFDTVELNGVFYRLPKPEAVKHWYHVTPKHFLFAYKASRYITHMKKLHDVREGLQEMFSRADLLKEKLGPILFQLPHFFAKNAERLKSFLQELPRGYDYVMEFRHPSWFDQEVYDLLEKRQVGLCLYDMRSVESPVALPAQSIYVRFHGSEQQKYHGNYTDAVLETWARRIRQWQRQDRPVYVYFNNDVGGHAVRNAQTLQQLLAVKVVPGEGIEPTASSMSRKRSTTELTRQK